jgi:hypothetical protein
MAWLLALGVLAQDVVQLRNGRTIAGAVHVDKADTAGFTVEPWETGGRVHVLWDQVPPGERIRLLGLEKPLAKGYSDRVEGVLVRTPARDVFGVTVKEEAGILHVRTNRGVVQIPLKAVVSRLPVEIHEAEIFSEEERLARRQGAGDAASLIEAGRFAERIRRFDDARGLYVKAGELDAARKDEVAELLVRLEARRRDAAAEAKLEAALEAADKTQFKEALKLAEEFLAEFAGTEAALANANLVATLQAEAAEYHARREAFLARKVPGAWRRRLKDLASELVRKSHADARLGIAALDDRVEAELAARYKSDPLEIRSAWQKREVQIRSVGYGAGTWMARGLPDGGMDYADVPPDPAAPKPQIMIPFPMDPNKKPLYWIAADASTPFKPFGRPLLTREEWWAIAAGQDRREWVETEYARTSKRITVLEERSRACGVCLGFGQIKALRAARTVPVICPRCHGAKDDISVRYW